MTTERDNGGPAFPSKQFSHMEAAYGPTPSSPMTAKPVHIDYHGMSLRDYFAAKALQGMLASEHVAQFSKDGGGIVSDHAPIAVTAYRLADAMLLESSK